MIAGHGVDQCKHGTVVRQCRCVTHNEVRVVACPPTCSAEVRLMGPVVAGEPSAVRLMRAIRHRLAPDARRLTHAEVAVVLDALADHTAILAALQWRRQEPPESPWQPEATSMGRWFHDVADQLRRHQDDS